MRLRLLMQSYDRYVFDTVKKYKFEIFVVIGLFFVGFLWGMRNSGWLADFSLKAMSGLFDQFQDVRGFKLALKLLTHNFLASVFGILLGVFFSVFPVVSSFFNGFLIGMFMVMENEAAGLNPLEFVLLLLPHGIFEIPALIMALALGVHLGTWPFRQDKVGFVKNSCEEVFQITVKLILPLLFIAAVIETIGIETTYFLY